MCVNRNPGSDWGVLFQHGVESIHAEIPFFLIVCFHNHCPFDSIVIDQLQIHSRICCYGGENSYSSSAAADLIPHRLRSLLLYNTQFNCRCPQLTAGDFQEEEAPKARER
jgi:hypothetical protein